MKSNKMNNPYLRMKMVVKKKMVANKRSRSRPQLIAFLVITFFSLAGFTSQAQTDSTLRDRKKLNTLIIVAGAGYAAGLITLDHVWYKNTERQSFRFFNDNAEWKQVDKAGHIFASYYLSDVTSRMLKRCGVT